MEVKQTNTSLSSSRPDTGGYAEPINQLPRAVLRPNNYLLLDGDWQFSLDPDDRGLQDQWYNQHTFDGVVQWPGSIEAHMAQARGTQSPEGWHDKVVAWYERTFTLPDRSASVAQSIIQLTFGACGYETRVWLNGQLLSTIEDEAVHFGEYTSFSYELPDELLEAENRLTVRIADTMDAAIPRGKQESHVYKRGGIWYQTYTGAVRSVWLESVERNRLRSRVGVASSVEDRLVRFTLTTRVHDAGNYTIRLTVVAPKTGEVMATSDYPLHLNVGQKRQRVTLDIPDAQLWSPETPVRYKLIAQLIDPAGYAAQIETHFGLRKIESRGRHIYLNNESIYLDGILYQPGTATFEEMQLHMRAMKELGCNLVRVHIAGVDPRIYNLADQLGLLLWVEVPSPHVSNTLSRQNHKAELLRMLALIGSHPSVIIWSLYNEDWGAEDIAVSEETRQYITDMYHFMQLSYPQFLVVDNDGWRHISVEGRLKSDLLTAHLYTPDLNRWRDLLSRLEAGQLEGVAAFPLVVGDPFFYRKQVPLIVSEWGGFGFADYGGPNDSEDRAERILQFKQELRRHCLAGDIYTQATNIEDERNGLIDPHTGELSVPAGLLNSRNPQTAEVGQPA